MVEFDGTVEVVRPDGPVPFPDLFQGRDELVIYPPVRTELGFPIAGSDHSGVETPGPLSYS